MEEQRRGVAGAAVLCIDIVVVVIVVVVVVTISIRTNVCIR